MNEEVSSRNTKKEILDAYQKLLKQMKEDKRPEPGEEPRVKTAEKTTEKPPEKQKPGMMGEASGHQPDKVMKDISNLKISINQSLDRVEEALILEHKKLSEVSEAIREQKNNLLEIHRIKAEADSLESLILTHKEKQQELEQEIKEQRAVWAKEKQQAEQESKEEKERSLRAKVREEDEYTYNRDQKRKKEEDLHNEKVQKQEKELKEKREAFEKEMQEREAGIKAKEEELRDLRIKASQFPDQLEKALNQKEEEITLQLTSDFRHDRELLKK